MYLKTFRQAKAILKSRKNFSILDSFNRNTLAYRLGKYDPTKELEVIKL